MPISRDEVSDVAFLARLRLEPAELDRFTEQLSSIVDFVAQLREPETANVEPLAHGIDVSNVFRVDRLGGALTPKDALANAPKRDDECFLVPVVIE
jgi:aspartyl-tRNA(Asn)/glutamyl-tRNA(Gln) amidotransferase subunit C